MKNIFSILGLALLVSACGVKQGPSSPVRPNPDANLDCSIYEAGCPVKDPKYDPACDPAKPNRPAICEIWNKKYEKARAEYRNRVENPQEKPKTLTPNDVTP